jgi:hypothetical protein
MALTLGSGRPEYPSHQQIGIQTKDQQKSFRATHTLDLDLIDIVDIYRVFHPSTRKYMFFSAAHGTFSKIGHIVGHKASLNKFKKTEIISLSYQITMG